MKDIAAQYLPWSAFTDIDEYKQIIKEQNGRICCGRRITVPVSQIGRYRLTHNYANSGDFASGIYLTAKRAGNGQGRRSIESFHKVGGNSIIFDIKDIRGKIYLPFDNHLAAEVGSPDTNIIPDPADLISFIHDRDMQAVGRITCFADKKMFKKKPAYRLYSKLRPEGVITDERLHWVNPANPNVVGYLLSLIQQSARDYDLDEIHLDYVRFPNFTGRLLFQNGCQREDIITAFLKKAYYICRLYGVRLTIAVYGITIWENEPDIATTGQRLTRLASHCDGIHPMLYASHYEDGFAGFSNPADHPTTIISKSLLRLQESLEKAGKNVIIRPWVQAFSMNVTEYDEKYILENIKGANIQENGYYFWNAGNRYDEVFKAMSSKLSKIPEK